MENRSENDMRLDGGLLSRVEAYLAANYREPDAGIRWSCASVGDMSAYKDLPPLIDRRGETFSCALIRLIGQSGMTAVDCYKKALVTKQHFSKIQGDADYQPSKGTVLAFAIALALSIDQAEELLKTAGFAFSDGRKADVIVKFAITHRIHDIFTVNALLEHYNEKPLP